MFPPTAPQKQPEPKFHPSSETARWGAVTFFALATAWNYLDRNILNFAAPRIKAEFHLSNTDFGWLISAFSLPYAIAAPAVGWLLDRLGLELGIVLAVGLWSLAAVLCGMSRGYGQLLGARVFLGLFESAGVPAAGKLNSIYLAPKDRAVGAAMTQIGIGLAGIVAPFLVAHFTGWRSPFFVSAALGTGWIPVWMLIRWKVRPYQLVAPQKHSGAMVVLKDRRLIILSAANVLWMLGFTLWSNWLTIYLTSTFKLSLEQVQKYAWVAPVASTLGGFAGGALSRYLAGRGMPVVQARIFAILLSCFGCLTILFAPFCATPLLALVPLSISNFAILAGSVNIYTLPVDVWGGERAGIAIAGLGVAYGLMQTAVSPLIGSLVDHFGFTPLFWIVALPPFVAWLLLKNALVK